MDEDTQRVAITRLPLGGFVRFAACFGASVGLVVGVAGLVLSPFGVLDFHVADRWGGFGLSGIRAGMLFFCVWPVYFTVLFTVIAFPAYLPFRLISRVLTRYRIPADCVAPNASDAGDRDGAAGADGEQPPTQPDADDGAG